MPLTVRPTGLGAGIDKDRQDFTIYSGGCGSGSARLGLSQKGALPSSGEQRTFWFKVADARIPRATFCRRDEQSDTDGGRG